MKYSLILFVYFGLTIGLDAADDKSKEINMPETFISGDASKGSQLVESCAACHGADGNSISTDWPKLNGQNQRYLYCLLYTSPSPRDMRRSRMPSSA